MSELVTQIIFCVQLHRDDGVCLDTANRSIFRSNLTAVIILQQFHSPCVDLGNILLQAVRGQSKQSWKKVRVYLLSSILY